MVDNAKTEAEGKTLHLHDSALASSRGIIPAQNAVTNPGLDSERDKPPTVKEVIYAFAERRHFIGVLQRARILFDPKSLPGVTPEESLDFLIRGLRPEDPKKLRQILGSNETIAQNVRENFPAFIEYMNQQNNERTIAEIWRAVDADPFTKMALQWEIQTPKQFSDEYIEEHADPVAADLRKLDALLKGLGGVEILMEIDDVFKGCFIGLTTADGRGIDFVQSTDPNNPHREVVLGSQAASTKDTKGYKPTEISVTERLIIPFEVREVLRTRDAESWDRYKDDFWRSGKYHTPFDPTNPFPAFIIGEELNRLRKDDSGLDNKYNALKKAIEGSASDSIMKT